MYKIFIGVGILLLLLSLSIPVKAAETKTYWIDGGHEVLAFVEMSRGSKEHMPLKLKLFEKQQIALRHKKSGPGLWAFELEGLIIERNGLRTIIQDGGFIVVKKRWLVR